MKRIIIIIRKLPIPSVGAKALTDCNSHCTLNTHGHLDQKRVTVESIGSFVDIGERGSSGKRRADDNASPV